VVAILLLAIALVLAALTTFWYVTKTGPFSQIEPSTWALTATQVTDLQAQDIDGTGVRICIVDSGVELSHPELERVNLIAWRDYVGRPPHATPYDDEGHGTAMTGIIFAQGILRGVAPNAGLIAVKAIGSTGTGTDGDIASAIGFCLDPNGNGDLTDDGANVISLSLGEQNQPFLGSQTVTAVNNALDRGVIVVAAAGNDGGPNDDGDVESPASQTRVIAVGAVERDGAVASFSSIGGDYAPGLPPSLRVDPSKKPEVVAPGVQIAVALTGGRYGYVGGTSPAAAFVSGMVALVLQRHPSYEWNAVRLNPFKTALMDSAAPEPGQQVPHDPHYGYGLVQVAAWDVALP